MSAMVTKSVTDPTVVGSVTLCGRLVRVNVDVVVCGNADEKMAQWMSCVRSLSYHSHINLCL